MQERFTNSNKLPELNISEALANAGRLMQGRPSDAELQEQFDLLSQYVGKLEGNDSNFKSQLREVRAELAREIYRIRKEKAEQAAKERDGAEQSPQRAQDTSSTSDKEGDDKIKPLGYIPHF